MLTRGSALHEPTCQDDLHVEEEVAWLALDAGTWFTDDDKMIQVRLDIPWAVMELERLAVGWWVPPGWTPVNVDRLEKLLRVMIRASKWPRVTRVTPRQVGRVMASGTSVKSDGYGGGLT